MHFRTIQFMHNRHKKNQNLAKLGGRHLTAIQCCPGVILHTAYCILHTFQDGGRLRPRKRCYCWLLTFPASWRSTDASCRPVGPLQATWSCTETDGVYCVHLPTFRLTEFWMLLVKLHFSFSTLKAWKISTSRERQLVSVQPNRYAVRKRHVILTQSCHVSVFRHVDQN